MLIVGTRPEAIKVAPVYRELKKQGVETLLCSTGQHSELLKTALQDFSIEPDVDFALMKPGQDLFHIHEAVMEGCKKIFAEQKPSFVLVQGDTTSATAAALAAFYSHIPVGHIEAGLRSGHKKSPFPEEMNRRLISQIADLHFAPTGAALENLNGVEGEVYYTGNTVVDALQWILKRPPSEELRQKVGKAKGKKMLFTLHRRELSDEEIRKIFRAVKGAVEENFSVFYPAHPNPRIQKLIEEENLREKVEVMEPLSYADLIYLIQSVDFVATDSGGIQEEAVSLGKPVLVLRKENDRTEKGAYLVDLNGVGQAIEEAKKMNGGECSGAYGDGHAAERIVDAIVKKLHARVELFR